MEVLDIALLPDDPVLLKGHIAALQQDIRDINDTYSRQIKYFQEQTRIMQARLYGRTSEKIPEAAYGQGTLFDEAELSAGAITENAANSVKVIVPGYVRNKVGRHPLPASLPREEKIIDLTDEEKVHSCGRTMVCIGEERSEKIKYIPPQISVEAIIRKKYACPCEGVDSPTGEGAVRIAPMPNELIPKSYASASLMAHIITSKFCDALPLYRLEKVLKRVGIILTRQIMSFWIITVFERFSRMRDILLRDIRGGPVIGIDETPVQVHNEPDRKDTTKSFMWVARGAIAAKPILLYTYSPTRCADVAKNILGDFSGVVQCDGFSAYDVVAKNIRITRAGCWAHVRRKFVEAAKAVPEDALASEMVQMIGELYGIEQEAIEHAVRGDALREYRISKAAPIVESIREWLDKQLPLVTPASALGKAIQYANNEWKTLIVYLHNGEVRIDNNLVENAIRPFVLGRKNWLFSGSPRGADASAFFYSLIETAKANGLEPYAYLLYLFERLPNAQSDGVIEALLPYRVTLPAKTAI